MVIEIVVRRHGTGRLDARVRQDGRFGADLLRGRSLTNVESAKAAARQRIFTKYDDWAGEVEIRWTVKA